MAPRTAKKPPASSQPPHDTRGSEAKDTENNTVESRSSGQPDPYEVPDDPPGIPAPPSSNARSLKRARKGNAAGPRKKQKSNNRRTTDQEDAAEPTESEGEGLQPAQEPTETGEPRIRPANNITPVSGAVSAGLGDMFVEEYTSPLGSYILRELKTISDSMQEISAPGDACWVIVRNRIKELKGIAADYKSIVSSDPEKQENTYRDISNKLRALESKISEILKRLTKIKDPELEKSMQLKNDALVSDVFMYMAPVLSSTLSQACQVHLEHHQHVETQGLRRILILLKLLKEVLKPAVEDDSEVRTMLEETSATTYTQLFTIVEGLYKRVKEEIDIRLAAEKEKRAEMQARRNRAVAAEKERQKLLEEEAKRREKNELIRQMNKSIRQNRAKLGLPAYATSQRIDDCQLDSAEKRAVLEKEIERLADYLRISMVQERRLKQAQEYNSNITWLEDLEVLEAKSAMLAEEIRQKKAEFRKLGGRDNRSLPFGTNNVHLMHRPEWTRNEMVILIDGLREERGPDRYLNISAQLNRSVVEIREKSLEFKMTIQDRQKQDLQRRPRAYHPPLEDWIESIGNDQS